MNQSTSFAHVERAPYELGYLLRALPRHLHAVDLSDEQRDIASAAAIHASNYSSTLLSGLESAGRVMWAAAHNKEQTIELSDIASMGMLVAEIAVQLQFLSEFRSEVDELTIRGSEEQSK